jgi:uncharacterized damage-inducible protein DinB
MNDGLGVSFRDLLAYNHAETERWHKFFVQHPQALALDAGGQIGTVRNLIKHIFQTELYFALRLTDQVLPKEKYEPNSDSIDDIFYLHERAHGMLAHFLSVADEADLSRKHHFEFAGGFDASSRKIVLQFFWHGINHWGQIAMLVRQAGMPTEGPRDIILSKALP